MQDFGPRRCIQPPPSAKDDPFRFRQANFADRKQFFPTNTQLQGFRFFDRSFPFDQKENDPTDTPQQKTELLSLPFIAIGGYYLWKGIKHKAATNINTK
ncbi:MAG: hypothetical protein II328_00845 [Clostridia bacterium]|nr:hypothetical protein [Clostridia bacterium]